MPRFSPDYLDELRSRLRASDVIGRVVTLKKEGREFRGLSPFTAEKTPSFFVNDEKGRYFDFSAGKSGDIITFLMDVQKMSFPDAVMMLAEMAGLPIPEDSPQDRAREEKSRTLADASLDAAKFFRSMLGRSEGREAMAYLQRRQVPEAAIRSFGLGYAPQSRNALKDHLLNKDYPPEVLVEAGLLIGPDDGSAPYDRFRDRVMFPIIGTRGQIIAFGGRALQKDAKAKYLNSPETPLFHKSNTLYNLGQARRVAGKTDRPIIVAEGYMDVISIAGAGWPSVAPLGTALTENQLGLLWRAQDTPILCFDGDRAGKAAAWRAIDRALPLLQPGKSLKFMFLPDGMDPDDLIKKEGPEAFRAVLEKARPLADVLWERENEQNPRSTPEEDAQFRRHLRDLVRSIADGDVRRAYGDFIADKLGDRRGEPLVREEHGPPPSMAAPYPDYPPEDRGEPAPSGWQARPANGPSRPQGRPRNNPRGGKWQPGWQEGPRVSAELKARLQQGGGIAGPDTIRESILVIGLIHHPRLFASHEDTVMALTIEDRSLSALLAFTLDLLMGTPDLDFEALHSHILKNPEYGQTYQRWIIHPLVRLARFARPDADEMTAEAGWLNTLSIDRYQGDLEAEILEAAEDAHKDAGRERTWFDAVSHRARNLAAQRSEDDKDPGA
ncbi:DNA primase [Parvularcula sp. LCG005]|uniref:DNA primase n=1 Tax=Parvularcula sp. LCG005 TaxID=3078805 RepID=UPI002942B1BF|nr:DNA primase [Parvularcula sp. LCG005]WOI52050.1 DNA primase [Parvularcula sp. LCG005]